MSSVRKVKMVTYSVFHRLDNTKQDVVKSQFIPHQLRSKLLIKRQLDPLDVVAKLDGRSQFQVHALLHCWQVQQEKRLSINFLKIQLSLAVSHSIVCSCSNVFMYHEVYARV